MELRNAGLRDKTYFQKQIDYCTEFLALFPEADDAMIGHRRRSIAESYAYLGDYKKADLEFEKIVQDHPHDPWGHIAWGDIYYFDGCEEETDYDKARSLYRKALAVAEDKGDILAVRERLQGLEDEKN
jgi:tetratricopeptide (TPR) repeat protein